MNNNFIYLIIGMLTKKNALNISGFFKHLQYLENKTVFVYKNKNFSYQWLLKNSKKLASWLNLHRFTVLMFTTKNSPLTALLYLGGWLACRSIFPINPRLISHELIQIITKISPSVLLIEPKQVDIKLINYCSKYNIVLKIINSPLTFIQNLQHKNTNIDIYPINNQAVTYHVSSGTGGEHNYYGHTLSQILTYSYHRQFDLGLKPNDKLLISLSLNHAYAFSYQLLPGLAMGLSMVLLPEFDTKIVKYAITHHKITTIALLPTMYYLLCRSIQNRDKYNHRLRFLSVAGDQVQPTLMKMVRKILGIPLKNGIGMTEVYGYGQNTQANVTTSKIKLFDEIQCKINPLSLKTIQMTKRTIGEIYLKTPTQPIGYNDKWLATGDLGYLDNNRYLYFFGRMKNIIIKGGSNVSPVEIEHYLCQISSVDEVAVIGRKHKVWGTLICACIVTNNHMNFLTKANINEYLSDYLSAYKHIDEVYFMKKLPKNKMGKLDRSSLIEEVSNFFCRNETN